MAKGSAGWAANACRALGALRQLLLHEVPSKSQGAKTLRRKSQRLDFLKGKKKKIKQKNEIVLKRVTQKRC